MSRKIGTKILNAFLAASLCGSALPSAVFAATNDLTSTNQVPNVTQKTDTNDQVVIVYKKAQKDNIKDTSLQKSDISQATTVSKQVDVVTPAKGESTDTLKDKLKKDNNVASVCQNVKVKLSSLPNDVSGNKSDSESEASYKLVQADQTWNQATSDNKKIKIAVIDGGISTTSEDLKDRVETPINEVSSGGSAGSPDHGTEVASIIAAEADNNKGIAGFSGKYDVSIVPYVCEGSSDSDGAYIDMDAILASLSDIASKKEASVINMSFALQKDAFHDSGETEEESKKADASYEETKTALQTAINKCADNGVVAVAAAGNKGDNTSGEEVLPADLDNVISVGATDSTGATASCNFNDNADIFAPGENLSVINSSGNVVTGSGTSFSSPIVAANVAQLMSDKLPNGKYADASAASTAVTKTSIDTVKDKRLASFATSRAYLKAYNQKDSSSDSNNTKDSTTSDNADAKTTTTVKVNYSDLQKAVEDAGVSADDLTYTVDDTTYTSDATITVPLKDGKISDIPYLTITSPSNLDVTSTWKDADGNEMTEGETPSASGYTLSDIEVSKLSDDPVSYNNIKFTVSEDAVKEALVSAGITGVPLKYNISTSEKKVPYGYPIDTLPTVTVTSPEGYTMTGTWVDQEGNPIDEYTMAPQENSTTYTLTKIKITKTSDSKDSGSTEPKDNYKTYYNIDTKTNNIKIPDGVTIKASPASVDGDIAPDKANVKIIVTPDNYTVDGEWSPATGGGIQNPSGGTDGSTQYNYVVKSIKKKDDSSTTKPTDKKVKIKFTQGDNKLPDGLSFTDTTQEWTVGENFDISKFPKLSGKATDSVQVKSWFVDEDGKQVTNQTVVPDKDATYTLHLAMMSLPTASFSVDTSECPLPSGVSIKLSKDEGTIPYSRRASDLEFPEIEVTPNDEYTVSGKWVRKSDGKEIDPQSDTVLINGDGVVNLVYKVTSIVKKDKTNNPITLKCNVNDISKAAGKLIKSGETLKYKIDGKTYTGDAVIQLAVKDGKIDHVPFVEIISPQGLTLQGVWKDAKGNVLTKDTKYSDTYVLSDITISNESSAPSGQSSNASSSSAASPSSAASNADNGKSSDTSPKTGVNSTINMLIVLAGIVVVTVGLINKVIRLEKDKNN